MFFNIVVTYCCKRKILKETETEETIDFCHIFVIGEISIGGGRAPWAFPHWLRLCSNKRKQKKYSQIFREISGVFQQNFNCSKNGAVLEPRTGQFLRT